MAPTTSNQLGGEQPALNWWHREEKWVVGDVISGIYTYYTTSTKILK